MYIDRISVNNFRIFEQVEITFLIRTAISSRWTCLYRRIRDVNLLVGDNGAGKSSLLKAI